MRLSHCIFLLLATCCSGFAVSSARSMHLLPTAAPSTRVPAAPRAVARSKEAQANMDKWGKILSQADTFDDTLPIRKRGQAPKKPPGDKNAGGSIVLLGSAAVLLAMSLSQVGH